jgi:hypothetical protein
MASTNNENNVKVTVYGMILPLILGVLAVVVSISGFMIVKWMASVDSRLASIEADQKQLLQLQYRIEMLEKKAGISAMYHRHTEDDGAAIPPLSDYFIRPSEIVLKDELLAKYKRKYV